MKQQQFLGILGLAGVFSVLVTQPAYTYITDSRTQITQVRINITPSGFQVVLDTDTEPQVFSASYGRTFLADITNARLQLGGSNTFTQENPAPGIASVTITQAYANTVRVKVIGSSDIATAQVSPSPQGLLFSFNNLPETTAQQRIPSRRGAITTPVQSTTGTGKLPSQIPSSSQTIFTGKTPSSETSTAQFNSQVTPTGRTTTTTEVEEDIEDIEVVVTATRRQEAVTDVTRSVTVINREQIEQQTNLSRNLNDVLANLVPGLGASNQGTETYYQSLRGRNALILIDGVPQNANTSTAFANELRTIDPAAIERIEVVRGASSTYGGGATGGIINIITRKPSDRQLTLRSEVAIDSSLTNLDNSLGTFISQFASGKYKNFDYTASLSRTGTGTFYDAAGDRIPNWRSNLNNTETYNFLGKVGVNLDEQQRLQLSGNFFKDSSRTDYISDTSIDFNDIPGEKARALRIPGLQYANTPRPGNETTNLNLDYSHQNILGSSVQAQAYYRSQTTYDQFFSLEGFQNRQGRPAVFDGQVQGRLEGNRWGGRLQIDTPLFSNANILWGVDYATENNTQVYNLFDKDIYANSGNRVLSKNGELTLTPLYNVNNLGLFAQVKANLTNNVTVNGGIRNERISFSVNDYTTIFDDRIRGGSRSFSSTVFNVGTVYNATKEISLYADFSQGFSIPDLGRILRNPPAGFVDAGSSIQFTEPQTVNNYELGIRGNWQSVKASLVGFYNQSNLGATLVQRSATSPLEVVRTPERIYGVEATVDWQAARNWQVGGTVSLSEGESDIEGNGNFVPFDVFRIQPAKYTAYVENQTNPNWRNRLQLLYVGDRDRAFLAGNEPVPIKGYVTLDYVSSIKLGKGTLQIGVENLLNSLYFSVQSQQNAGFDFDSGNVAARGRSLRVGYSLSW